MYTVQQCFGSGSVDPRAKNTNKKGKFFEMSCFEELDVLTGGLEASLGVWKTYIGGLSGFMTMYLKHQLQIKYWTNKNKRW
jgi:hypothetical protein